MSNISYPEALDDYYKLKRKYDERNNKIKHNIIKNKNISKKDWHREYLKALRCVNCNQSGGTIFTNQDNVLTAKCGNRKTPCNLNIQIRNGDVVTLDKIIQITSRSVDQMKQNIIKTKLDLLFQYISEDSAIKIFEDLKAVISEDQNMYTDYLTKYLHIVDNPEKEQEINEIQMVIYSIIEDIKSMMSEFQKTTETSFAKDAVDAYVSKLQPLLNKRSQLMYSYMAVEYDEDEGIYNLVQMPYTVNDTEVIIGEEPKVLVFAK